MLPKLLATLLLATATLAAQTPPTPPTPTYDIVSIHRNKSDTGNMTWGGEKAYFKAENVPLATLLDEAYHIDEDHTSGLTGPLASARFDLLAKVSDAAPGTELTVEQRRPMMVALLAERFKLKAHIEQKTLPVYELIVLPGGPKFKPSAQTTPGGLSWGPTRFTGSPTSMAFFIEVLSGNVHRTIVDKTGLIGKYDLSLKWSPEGNADPQSSEPQSPDPPLFTALQEQLGLKLRPAKGPVDTLVIDHVEMSSEN